jgi:ankyrin repeat protein
MAIGEWRDDSWEEAVQSNETSPTRSDSQPFTEIARLLLMRGVNPNLTDTWGRTAMMMAAENGQCETVRLLLDWEADIHVKDHRGYTALLYGAMGGHAEIVKLLLDRGADPNSLDEKYGTNALMFAAAGPTYHVSRDTVDEPEED